MNPSVPTSLNLRRNTKFVKLRVVQMNSLCGTVALSEPPTSAPSSRRHVLFVSPSQPLKDLPSRMGTALPPSAALDEIKASERKTRASNLFINLKLCVDKVLYRQGENLSSCDLRKYLRSGVWGLGSGVWGLGSGVW